jgi:hypothetical protein
MAALTLDFVEGAIEPEQARLMTALKLDFVEGASGLCQEHAPAVHLDS